MERIAANLYAISENFISERPGSPGRPVTNPERPIENPEGLY
jgi:hypothetical protein